MQEDEGEEEDDDDLNGEILMLVNPTLIEPDEDDAEGYSVASTSTQPNFRNAPPTDTLTFSSDSAAAIQIKRAPSGVAATLDPRTGSLAEDEEPLDFEEPLCSGPTPLICLPSNRREVECARKHTFGRLVAVNKSSKRTWMCEPWLLNVPVLIGASPKEADLEVPQVLYLDVLG